MAGGTATPERIAIAERRHMALDMRRQGGSYRQIAESLREVEGIPPKYSHVQAQRDVTEMLRQINEANREAVAILKRLELERLDELWYVYWKPAIGGDIAAAHYLLRLMERRARLEGLDAPLTMKHSGDPEHPLVARTFTIKVDRRRDDDDFIGTIDGDTPVAGLLAAPGREGDGEEIA